MAAPMSSHDNHVRIKVYFENNEFDASWLLIDTSELRTMKDVQRYISLKFLGKTVPLYLTLQGCFLPDWEKSVILRENDCVNAKCIHHDSFENQTILVTNSPEDNEHNKKKKKKKDKFDSGSKQLSGTSSFYSQISKEKQNSKDAVEVQDSVMKNAGIDNSQNEVSCKGDFSETKIREKKKKKHKHDIEKEQNKKCKENRKRKLEKPKNDNDPTLPSEPVLKKMSVDTSDSQQFLKEDEEEGRLSEGLNKESSQFEQSSVSLADGLDTVNKLDVTSETLDSKKKTRKRKRVRKRKRKNETAQNSQILGTPKLDMVQSEWHWSTGKLYERETINTIQSSEKHKIFQSESNDSSDDEKTDPAKETSGTAMNGPSLEYGQEKDQSQSVTNYCSPKVRRSDTEQSFNRSRQTATERSNIGNNSLTENKQTAKIYEQPSILSTSYLTNGVAVYSRSRGKQQQNLKQYAELSKEDQLNTRLTNVSIILQNKTQEETRKTDDSVVYEAVPLDKNYSQCMPLVGPPRAGDRLAYKVVELSETYTPEVSEYKEAVVCSYNHLTKIIELKSLQDTSTKKIRPDGRFEMEFSDDEDMNTSTSQNTDNKVCLPIDSLVEPKLLS